MERLNFSYDPVNDILTVEGIKYSGEMFRMLGFQLMVGGHFSLDERYDGILTVTTIQ